MKIIHSLRHIKIPTCGSCVTVGVFDGVHSGHKKIISRVVAAACVSGTKSIVITFDPHPAKVLNPKSKTPSLISLGHRIRLIESLGVDILVIVKFTKTFSDISAEEFVKNVLVEKLRMRQIFVGENFYFGKDAAAGVAALKKLSRRFKFKVITISPIKVAGHIVSSSLIRRMITCGDLHDAAKLLARPVSVLGTIVKGYGLATELGFPTANINPHHEVVPPCGVYAVMAHLDGRSYRGVLNIGLRPTFYSSRDEEPTIEVHLFGFKGDLYGKDIEVEFVEKIRDERKFASKEALIKRIRADAVLAQKIL